MKVIDVIQRFSQMLLQVSVMVFIMCSATDLFAQTRLNQSVFQRDGSVKNFLLTPDKSKIVFLADFDTDEVFELYSASADGTGKIVKLNDDLGVDGDVRRLSSISVPFEITPDGNTVVYTANKNGGAYELYSVSINGGENTKLNGDLGEFGNVYTFKISPDGTKVVFETGSSSRNPEEIWSVSIFGGAQINLSNMPNTLERVIPAIQGEPSYKITPDGTNVVFRAGAIRSPENLYIVPLTGGTPSVLNNTSLSTRKFPEYQISPDGSRVIYAEQDDSFGQINLYSVKQDGTENVNLTGTLQADRSAFSSFLINSTSTRVVYISDKETDNKFELYSVPVAGGISIKLNGPLIAEGDVGGSNDDYITITPDGNRVLYRADAETDGVSELYSVPILGGTAVKLNGSINGGYIRRYLIMPNSDSVIYMADQAQPFQIELFSVPINGGTSKRIHSYLGSGDVMFFALSDVQPGRIIYTRSNDSFEPVNLYSVLSDGTQTLQLTDVPTGRGIVSDFQVTGDQVFFRSNLFQANNYEIFKVSASSPPFRWDGDDSNEWENSDNWINDEVPDITSDVIIKDVSNTPLIRQFDYAVKSLHLEGNAELIVNSDAGLYIDKTFSREGNGLIEVRRDISGNNSLSMIGSPVYKGIVEEMGIDLAFKYDETTNSFKDAFDDILFPGDGILVAKSGEASPVSFMGFPNTGVLSYELSVTGNDENGVQDGYNLVANPYMTSIDRLAFITENASKIDGNIWIWSDGEQNAGEKRGGDYIVVNNLGVATTVADSDGVSGVFSVYDEINDVIASSQGFFVLADSDGEMLTFTPSMQRLNPGMRARKTEQSIPKGDRLKISLSPVGKQNSFYNEIIIGLEDEATFGRDYGWDAGKFSGNDVLSFYSLQDGDQYAIQALPKPGYEPLTVDLGFYVSEKGDYQLDLKEIKNPGEFLSVNLIDRYTGNVINLKDSSYLRFTVESPGTYDYRFSVEFHQARVTVTEKQRTGQLDIISGSAGTLSFSYPSETAYVSIYDLMGRVNYERVMLLQNNRAEIKTRLNENEVYILKVNEETIKFKIR